MLIRFTAANYRSISEPIELSMVAIDRDREEARPVSLLGESLLPIAAIYGPNASGKSNVIDALVWLRDAVRHSLRIWEDEIPIEPFAFGEGPVTPSSFSIEIAIKGVRFEYLLELDREQVGYEGLFHYPEKKRRRIFEREGTELKLQRGLGGLSGTRELMTQRTLALSVARRFDEPLVTDFTASFMRMHVLGQTARHRIPGLTHGRAPLSTLRWFEQSGDQLSLFGESELDAGFTGGREQALSLLRLADLGIEDVIIEDQDESYSDAGGRARRRFRLLHRTLNETMPFEWHAESEGTRTWFALIGPVLTALRTGTAVLFDELDASLHPTLSAELLRIFHSPVTNPRGAQLVFTSHDASLLNSLNRDEVWLTEKRPDGSTRLGALADFAGERVRKSQNLENAYLHGRFGALPQVDQSALLRALGLSG
ncbi:ATP/GTP-binding protein [Nonomuraea sp. NPDC050394]|uniref:ATP/GTP-binding protein n=1 Tax=Nonomuraea sp. NPDC050394 TaxID=3364363 RepID=UPI0037AE0E25